MQELITAWEVIRVTPVKNDFPTAYINQVKDLIVEERFDDWLGCDFLEVLLGDLKDYSSAEGWQQGVTYQLDNKAIYEGCVFISLENDNTDAPVNSTKWKEAEKFETNEYNQLWQKLKKYLALCIIQKANTFTTYETDSGGTREVYNEDSGRKTASKAVLQTVTGSIQYLEAAAQKSLKRFIETAYDDSARKTYYETVDFLNCDIPFADAGKRRRRSTAYRH